MLSRYSGTNYQHYRDVSQSLTHHRYSIVSHPSSLTTHISAPTLNSPFLNAHTRQNRFNNPSHQWTDYPDLDFSRTSFLNFKTPYKCFTYLIVYLFEPGDVGSVPIDPLEYRYPPNTHSIPTPINRHKYRKCYWPFTTRTVYHEQRTTVGFKRPEQQTPSG